MAVEESNQWLFTEEEVTSTPSIIDGLSLAEERYRRAKGVSFISQAAMLLKLPQLTIAVASVFFHRFFMRISMMSEKPSEKDILRIHHYVGPSPSTPSPTTWRLPHSRSHANLKAKDPSLTSDSLEQNIAATALFLATKTEENVRKTKEIIIAVAKVAQKNASLIIDEQSKEYWRWRDNILYQEETMLELLTFDVVWKPPYPYLRDFIQRLQIQDNKPLLNVAWAFLNDSFLTTLCLLMPSKDIAIAAIYFGAKFNGTTIPDENEKAWWEQIGGSEEKVAQAINVMTEFWGENPLKRSENPFAGGSPFMPDDLERTRRRGSADSFTSSIGSQVASQASSPKRKEREREEEGEADEEREPAPKKQKSEPPSEASQ
jgi:protein BUR2